VQASGQRVSTPHFVLLVAAKQPDPVGPARLGIVVTRKVGNAVQRNRIKRVCRECFRMFVGLVPEGIELVVIARSGAHELGLADVRAEWERARPSLAKRAAAVLTAAAAASAKKNASARA